MRLGFVNGWSSRKQWDKVEVKVRISALTLFEIKCDRSSQWLKLTLLNLTINIVGN